jgi:hypothetical protein
MTLGFGASHLLCRKLLITTSSSKYCDDLIKWAPGVFDPTTTAACWPQDMAGLFVDKSNLSLLPSSQACSSYMGTVNGWPIKPDLQHLHAHSSALDCVYGREAIPPLLGFHLTNGQGEAAARVATINGLPVDKLYLMPGGTRFERVCVEPDIDLRTRRPAAGQCMLVLARA